MGASPTLDVVFIMRRNRQAGQWLVACILGNAAGMSGLQSAFRKLVALLRNESEALAGKAVLDK